MNNTAPIVDSQQSLDSQALEQVRDAARDAASWDVHQRPETPGNFSSRARAVQTALKLLETDLASSPGTDKTSTDAPQAPFNSALLELRENFRLLRSALTAVSENLRAVSELPRVIHNSKSDEPRVAAAASVYFKSVDCDFSVATFCTFIHELQSYEPLDLKELWSIGGFLKFALLESVLVDARALLASSVAAGQPRISACIMSLRSLNNADWASIIEPLIAFDATLREDPAQAYEQMDFESREMYRKRVALIARHSDCTESQIALSVLELARKAVDLPSDDPRIHRRRTHVGYYLIDKGLPQLAALAGFHPPFIDRVRMFIRGQADDFYIVTIELITVFFIAAALSPLLSGYSVGALALVVFLMLLPVMQDAVDLVNNAVTAIFGPQLLPKLDFSSSIPLECATLVAVPALLFNEEQVRKLVTDLEVRYLANRDPNLHFALLTDLPDSIATPRDKDSHPLVELAIELIDGLNARYSSARQGSFVLLHRHRIFNTRQSVWMGWERKRGKILDLNKLLVGEYDAFPIKAGHLESFGQIRYVLALDTDTQLPRGTAAQLIGAIAHPLNQAVIDPRLRIVTDGYGILQPRVGITVQSLSRSRLAAIYSLESGFDIYSRAVSDVYQDLFGEGSFTGKGIYEVAVFHSVLDHRFPRNALLSHDLIEGAYTRAGLVTDVELVEDYPSHYSAFTRRKHRWVRGDWQITQWMFARVPDESGHWAPNPISRISRWKIFDNLRRSLAEPFAFILFVAGWFGLPGGPLYWTVLVLSMLYFPAFVELCFGLGCVVVSKQKYYAGTTLTGFRKSFLAASLNLIFLPHQALLAFDAIIRSLVRRFVTGQRLLEWETAAQSESESCRRTPVDRYPALTPFVAFGLAILVYLFAPSKRAILFAAPILLLWALASILTAWLNRSPHQSRHSLCAADEAFMLAHGLRIWRFFHQFGGQRHNYLIPDNVEEEGLYEAARVSPTNLGLLLNARQAACELGFLTAPEFVALTNRTLETIDRLEKYRGHLYNWYNTESLNPLPPATVSSVDSGNFLASLYTLSAGALALDRQPLCGPHLFSGLRAHWQMAQTQIEAPPSIAQFSLPGPAAGIAEWIAWLPSADAALAAADASSTAGGEQRWWLLETRHRVAAILTLLHDYAPWLQPEYKSLCQLPELDLKPEGEIPPIDSAAAFSVALEERLTRHAPALANHAELHTLSERLRASLPQATQNLNALAHALLSIAQYAEGIAEKMEFSFLVDPGRRLLSVGYDLSTQIRHAACYDLLASEARIATFLSIARGDLPQQSWMNLGRGHTRAFSRFLLLSWTGTMFEYLMPSLWMRSYPDTLIARTLTACVQVQRAFARSRGIPWGISESGWARKDDAGHYQYQAFGIPQAALRFGATAGPTISPYSTFLALGVDPSQALRNLRRMDKAGWVGAYGFYEAVDYASSPGSAVVVREWMAHHQGMSLLAVLNLLHGDIVQQWFHANPLVRSTELLLNELPARKAVMRAKSREFAHIGVGAYKAI